MEAALLTAFLKYGVPLLIELLEKWGFTSAAEAVAAKTIDQIIVDVRELKTYREYPNDPKPSLSTSNVDR